MEKYEFDYDAAAEYWVKKDALAIPMDPKDLKVKIRAFLEAHNTCALATAADNMVRCTPIEYNYVDGYFYLFSEGGLKFKGLKVNKNVGLAIYETYAGFGKLKSLQVTGKACMVPPFSDEYLKLLDYKKIPVEAIRKLPQPMNLIRIIPETYDYLDSDLKNDGFGSRQHLDVIKK
ncbi:MAG: pyridoxamine 5'-phosphate oxidase family protein [Lachnospiraceae bacterium]|nr:pyridoxamine 5'-phosphate oxidase family protein [Lachnospiraceae bacterium]